MREIDGNRRLPAQGHGKDINDNWGVDGHISFLYHISHQESRLIGKHEQSQMTSYYSILIVNMYWLRLT